MLRRPMTQLMVAVFAFALVSFIAGVVDVQAQTPGSIKGVIRDTETGDLLDYANVLLKGTSRGTMSLGGGVFYFNGLAPGEYKVQVLYLGYAPAEETVIVHGGDQAMVSFDLEVVIVETLSAFDVSAEKYMVDIANATSEHKIDSEKFQRYAIDSVEDALARQAGVVMRGGQLYVRGGRSGEVSYRVSGVAVDNPLGGQQQISTLAVANMSLVTGGMDAEYGSAQSGVVNIVTRTGGDHFEGGVRYITDDFGRQDKTYTNLDRFEWGFGGPTPIKKLTYYFSGDLVVSDGENYSVANRPEYDVSVGDFDLFQFRRRQNNSMRSTIKLAYNFSETTQLTAEYSMSAQSNQRYAPNWNVSGYAQRVLLMPVVDVISMPGEGLVYYYTGVQAAVYYGPWFENMLETARPVVVTDFRSGSSAIRQTVPVLNVRDVEGNEVKVVASPSYDGFRYPDSAFSTVQEDSSYTAFNAADNNLTGRSLNQSVIVALRQNLTEDIFYNLRIGYNAFDYRLSVNGKDPWEYNHGGVASAGLFAGEVPVYLIGTDYYTDPLNPLFITTSDSPTYQEQYARNLSLNFDLTSSVWEGHLAKTGLTIVYDDLEEYSAFRPAIETVNRFTDEYTLGAFTNEFRTFNPTVAWFLQDRWEHEGMVVNYGARWDLFSPGSAAAISLQNEDLDTNVLKYKSQFSPRLGFAFPITERDGFSFSYGRYVQFPDRDVLFASQNTVGNLGTLGNPNLSAETTIGYQAGIKHQFTDFLAGSFMIYNRDIYDLIAATQITDETTGNTLARYINKAYASSRGVELTLNRRFANQYSFDISYSFSYADGVASSQEFGANPNGLEYLPNQELPLNWDQRHTLSLMLAMSVSGWSGSVDFGYGSGFPWTPVDRYARRQDPLMENSERLPATYNLTIQAERKINFYGQDLTLYIQGFNLINQDIIRGTAAGINPGMNNATAAYGAYLTETGKYGGAYLMDADGDSYDEFIPINDPRIFDQHRLFRVGVGWQF